MKAKETHSQAKTHLQALVKRTKKKRKKLFRKVAIEQRRERIKAATVSKEMGKCGAGPHKQAQQHQP